MFILIIPLLIAVAVIVAVRRRADTHAAASGPDPEVIATLAARWRSAGLITVEAERAVVDFERAHAPAPTPPASHGPVVAEVLGYVGAILAAIGIGIVVANVELSLRTGAILALVLGGLLIATGAAVPGAGSGPWWRFRQVLWLLGLAGVTTAVGLEVGGVLERSGAAVVLWCGLAAAVVGAPLYGLRNRPVQFLACTAGLIAATISGAMLLSGGIAAACALTAIGVLGVAAAARGALPPRWLALATATLVVSTGPIPAAEVSRFSDTAVFWAFGLSALITGAAMLVGHRRHESAVLVPALAVATVAISATLSVSVATWMYALAAAGLVGFGLLAILEAWDGSEAESIALQLAGGAALLIPAGVLWAHLDQDAAPGFVALLAGILAAGGLTAVGALRARPWLAAVGLAGIVVYVPWVVGQFFEGPAVPVALVLVGLVGIAAAVRSLRHRAAPPTPPLLGP